MSNVSKSIQDEFQRYRDIIKNELSAFLKECPICKNKFKDTLDERIICIVCERNQKIDSILK
jgi:hypothetical protein